MIKRKEDAKANREYTWEVMVIDTLDPIAWKKEAEADESKKWRIKRVKKWEAQSRLEKRQEIEKGEERLWDWWKRVWKGNTVKMKQKQVHRKETVERKVGGGGGKFQRDLKQ